MTRRLAAGTDDSGGGWQVGRARWTLAIVGGAMAVSLSLAVGACRSRVVQQPGIYDAANEADCLPSVRLTDQHGRVLDLAVLKGKVVLADFIYTSCPGPCEVMTAQLARVARHLDGALGSKVEIVSITLDPEHDGPVQMLNFAKTHDAERKGWLFLSGAPKAVETVMAAFKVERRREPNGMIDHVIEFFLVGPDGRELRQYSPQQAAPKAVAQDVLRFAAR